jgi:hypothetical protein
MSVLAIREIMAKKSKFQDAFILFVEKSNDVLLIDCDIHKPDAGGSIRVMLDATTKSKVSRFLKKQKVWKVAGFSRKKGECLPTPRNVLHTL